MSWLTLARVHGLPGAAIVISVGCALGWGWAVARFDFPMADGPRIVQQYLVAFVPPLLSVALIDRLPDISATLPRARTIQLVTNATVVVGTVTVLAPTWMRVPTTGSLYEAFIASVELIVVLTLTPRFGVVATLVATTLGIVWLLGGNSLGSLLGFGFLELGGASWNTLQPRAWGAVAVVGLGLLTSVAVAMSTGPTTHRSNSAG